MTAPNKIHGKTREVWDKMCIKKQRFADEMSCRVRAQHGMSNTETKMLWIYRCPNCRGYHMTHKPGRDCIKGAVTPDNLYFDDLAQMEL